MCVDDQIRVGDLTPAERHRRIQAIWAIENGCDPGDIRHTDKEIWDADLESLTDAELQRRVLLIDAWQNDDCFIFDARKEKLLSGKVDEVRKTDFDSSIQDYRKLARTDLQ